jgi:Fe-S cluster assembly ATP-binding protein
MMDQDMDMLTIEDLWVSIDGKEALKGFNLRIPPGETHILFGRNGSGKLTLIRTGTGHPGNGEGVVRGL